jgi:hypothetical protein
VEWESRWRWRRSDVYQYFFAAPASGAGFVACEVRCCRWTAGWPTTLDNPQFTGFIESRDGSEPVLLYRQKKFKGELRVSLVQRIDFIYTRDKTYEFNVTLKNGQKLTVEAEGRDFLIVKGETDSGSVSIRHPDPISSVVRISTKKPNREKDLTIQYLEFPR